MEKDRIFIECKECGEEFEYFYSGRGKKPIYCDACKKKIHYQQVMRSMQKAKEKKQAEKAGNLLSTIKSKPITIIDVPKMRAEKLYMDYTKQTLELLGKLDSLRVDMCNLATELAEYQSDYDKKDQEFIHKIENTTWEDEKEALLFLNNWHNDRASRRNVKGLIKILRDNINVIPLKCKFTAINNISNKEIKNEKI